MGTLGNKSTKNSGRHRTQLFLRCGVKRIQISSCSNFPTSETFFRSSSSNNTHALRSFADSHYHRDSAGFISIMVVLVVAAFLCGSVLAMFLFTHAPSDQQNLLTQNHQSSESLSTANPRGHNALSSSQLAVVTEVKKLQNKNPNGLVEKLQIARTNNYKDNGLKFTNISPAILPGAATVKNIRNTFDVNAEPVSAQRTFAKEIYPPEEESSELEKYDLTISGRVLSDDGMKLEEVSVSARLLHDARRTIEDGFVGSRGTHSLKSDEDGQFRFENLQVGRYRIWTESNGQFAASSLDVKSGSQSVDLIVNALFQVQIQGTVVDELEMPLDQVEVTISPNNEQAVSKQSGSFVATTRVKREQLYHITFERNGYRNAHLSVTGSEILAAKDGFQANAKLYFVEGLAAVSGRLYDQQGNALSGQLIKFHSKNQNSTYSVRTDTYGEFTIENVAASKDYRVAVLPPRGYEPLVERDLSITPNPAHFDFVLQRSKNFAVIEGRIINPQGNPIPNFTLIIDPKAGGGNQIVVRSNALGEFVASDVPAGSFTVRTSGQPSLLLVNANVLAGQTTILNVPVDWGSQFLSGSLVDQTGVPVTGAKVVLHWAQRDGRILSQTMRSARSDSRGQFRFSNLGEGMHTLSITKAKYESVEQKVDVTNGTTPVQIVVGES